MKKAGISMKVHQAIARALIDNGIDTLFGLLGDANLFMLRSFAEEHNGRFVSAANEAGATLMAIGYSTTSGKPGVVSVTHGPGMTNALTALVEGVKAQVPLLFLCGDTPAGDKDHFQNVSQREFIIATGAGFEQLRSPDTVARDLATALRRAVLERRPVALNMPADYEWQDTVYEEVIEKFHDYRPGVRENADLDDAVGIIASARSPIVLAGRGAAAPEAEAALKKLAERVGGLLATTLKGRGLFKDDEFNLGVFGTLSTPAAGELIAQSDCVISFGASLNKFTSAKGSYLQGKRVIQCNLVPAWVGAGITPAAGLIGDPAHIAETLMYWLDEAEIPASGFRNEDVRQHLAKQNPFADLPDTSTAETVDLTRSLLRLNEVIAEDRIFVCDVGRYVGQAWKAIDVAHPSAYVHTVHYGSIGLGLPCGIGASVAFPDRPVLVVTGDGGFMLGGLAEFQTAVRCNADLIVVVCNDGGYGAEHVQYVARDLTPALSLFDWPEFASVAEALGGSGIAVRNQSDLESACDAIAHRTGPLLIDLKLDPERMIALDY
ncbi:MAG: acetolactate synthase-1/2/3 large subunit [Halieaceae bacterium]|jgi:acetolactate synthase-1/2/3 large subunit